MAAIITHNEQHGGTNHRRLRITLASGDTSPWYFVGATGTVTVKPTSTMRVELTGSPPTIVTGDNINSTSNAVAVPWEFGDSSETKGMDFTFTTAVRFVSTGGTGIGEISE